MKSKEKKDLHTKSVNELRTMLGEAKAALMTLKLDHSLHKLKNTTDLRRKRVDIARIQSILQEKVLEDAKEVVHG